MNPPTVTSPASPISTEPTAGSLVRGALPTFEFTVLPPLGTRSRSSSVAPSVGTRVGSEPPAADESDAPGLYATRTAAPSPEPGDEWEDGQEAPPLTADTLIVATFEGDTGIELAGSAGGLLSKEQEIELWKLLVGVGAKGTTGEAISLPSVTEVPSAQDDHGAGQAHEDAGSSAGDGDTQRPSFRRILAVGLGDPEELSEDDIRRCAGETTRALAGVHTAVSTLGLFAAEAAALGHVLGGYSYRGLSTTSRDAAPATEDAPRPTTGLHITVLTHDHRAQSPAPIPADSAGATPESPLAARVRIIAESVALARDFVNAPANRLYPEVYADTAAAMARQLGLEVEVLDERALAEQGFGGIVGVGQGSAHPPRLLRLGYVPVGADSAADGTPAPGTESNVPTPSADGERGITHVALVGKGVTFDTGGISLKPGAKMWDMISDMGGSAAVIASVFAAARLRLPLRVTATIPMAENMPSATAIRPGDVLRHYNGTTTEVLNTDAEGRLILADALSRACEDDPDYLIETATLTGAQIAALGARTTGIMGSIRLRDTVAMISQEVGEPAWPMPLPVELGEALTSDVADVRNISTSRWGGMSVAGHYLSRFITGGIEWVHLDIAGPAYNTGAAHGYTPKRATGVPVRTILATLEQLS